ncbi:MAG: GNAT family N-acetyltransferase [Proteobacteria bacterium]|nr:GNAT family N-acetyltransferase [Pseudomonadota bacterium]
MRLETERLILRQWREEDLEPFAAMSRDEEVMRWLGGVLTRERARAYMERAHDAFARLGMCRFAIERREDGAFIGACGLMPSFEELPVPPFIDMGWRLSREAWGHGYASEAARAVLHDGFTRLDLPEIDAITAAVNLRSRAVMERLGMAYDAELSGFPGPGHEPGDPMRPTVFYRARRP